jgi:hypothetical protein
MASRTHAELRAELGSLTTLRNPFFQILLQHTSFKINLPLPNSVENFMRTATAAIQINLKNSRFVSRETPHRNGASKEFT